MLDSPRGQDLESSRNVVEPTVTTERNLTAYGLNGTKYVRRVLVGHRKIHLNSVLNGKTLTRNMTVMVGHISRNDILTNIPDRLAGFSGEVRPLDGKGPKLQDGRFEVVHQRKEGVLETATFSEHPKRMSIQEVKTRTTPSPSLPLPMNQVQPSLVRSETQDQPTYKRQTPSRDRHHTKTSLQVPPSPKYRYSGRPKLSGSSTSLINSRQPTKSISSRTSSQMPEYKNPAGNVSFLPSSHPFGVGKETLKRKKIASQEPQPDDQGLLTEPVRGFNRDSSVTNLPEGTTDTENTNGDNFPKYKETINKTVPLYHRMSHMGTFPRQPNIGPFRSNRTSTPQHPYRSLLRRPILPRVNSTARNKVEPEMISSNLNPNHTLKFTWKGKNGTVIRLPPKLLSRIKTNFKNGSKAGVTVDKNTSKESNIVFPADNDADPKFNLSLSTYKAPSKSNDTIQTVNRGSENTIDHITNRDNSTTWHTIPHHQRVSGVISGRQNASNLKIRPTIVLKRKNNTVIRLPSKPYTRINVNSTTIHSLLKDSKYGIRHKDSKDASKESQIGLSKDTDTNLFANITLSTEAPMGTNETLQAINGGSENAIDHRNKEHNLPSITNRDQDLPRVTPRDHELSKTAVRDHDLPRVTNRDQDLARVTSRDQEISKIAVRDHDLPRVTNRDQDLPRVTSRDQEISKIANRDQDLPRVTSRDINTTIPMLIDQKVESEVVGQRENVPNQNHRTKIMLRRKDGTLVRTQKKLHTQIKPNSTSIHSGLKDADTKVVKGIKESVILSDKPKAESHYKLQTVAGGLEVGNDNTLPSITNRDQDLSRITNRDHHLPRVTNKDQDLPSDINRDNSTSMKQVIKEFKESTEPTVQAVAAGSENGIDNNSTTMQMEPEFNSHSKKGPTSNFTATVTMKKKNETVFRNTPKFKIKPNFHGDPKPSKESSTSRHTLPHNTLNRSPRPKSTQQRKNGTIIRPPPKVSPQLKPKSTTILDGTKGRKHSTDDPKLVWSSKVPLSTDKATSQTNTAFPIAEVSEDSINQVGVQNVTSKGFIIIWVAPEGRFKNFVIRIIEENDEGVNEGDGSNQEKEEERTEGSEITTNVIEVVRRNSSNDGVRKKFTKLLPGSARSYPVIDLTAQTNYSVTLYGTGRGLRSNVHTFIITTGPEPPSHLSFSEITDTSLTVSWRRPKSSVSGFKVTYIHTKEGEPISVTVDSSNSNLALSKLSPGSTYEVSVISVLGLDESDPIKDFVITLPDPPTDLRAINITDTKALLLWRPALATVDQYIITYHSEEAPGSDLSVRVSGNAVEQQLQALKESTKYSVTIISRLGEQKSSSTLTTFTTTSGSPGKGEAPRDLIAKQVTARSAVLSWKPPASAVTSYKLTYFTKGGERKEVTLNPGVTEHELRRLRPSSTYTALLQGERGGVYTAAISTEFTTGALRFPYPSDCSQELMNGQKESGLVEIFPGGKQGQPVMVYCDMETDGGGWTVFQRRKDGKTNFFRSWQEYRKGFGDLEGEFWLGNDFLHNLTTMTPMNLRVDLRSGDEAVYAHYSTFSLDTMKKHYMLRVSGYSGTAGDSLKYHDKRPFSTFDRDPQPFITRCSMSYRGGWWYKNCHEANLNGLYNTHTNHQGVIWTAWKGKNFSIPFSEMKIRPASFKPNNQ